MHRQQALLIEWVNRHVWLDGCDIATELRQASAEGRDLASVRREFDRLLAVPKPTSSWHNHLGGQRDERWLAAAGKLMDKVQTLPLRRDYPYREPSDWAGIRAARPRGPKLNPWTGSRAQFQEKLHGGLLGRIAGCLLGKPVEGWRAASIRIHGEHTGNWPVQNYFRLPTAAEARKIAKAGAVNQMHPAARACLLGGINGMVEDDDINYTTAGFAMVKKYGAKFRPLDVASFWGSTLPIFHTCTAERVAYRNFVMNILPPASAVYRNPYREWIGAQIRADYFGFANPGRPARAAEWAWRDATISHVKNGIYGAMWVAAMLAAAYVADDWNVILRAGLAQIPAQCRLRADVEKILEAQAAGASYEAAVALVHDQWDESNHHDWCHTNANAQIVAIGLLYGQDDYSQTIARAVMAGFDTDCNGATCGGLWGVKHGVRALPRKWTAPLQDTVRTGVSGYHQVSIRELAAEMTAVAWSHRP
jgi:ADP-ribosylglycohydrolase